MYTDLMKKTYETALHRKNSVSMTNWMYEDGVLCKGMEYAGTLLGDERYLPFLKAYADQFVDEDGTIHAVEKRPPSVDTLNNGKVVFTVSHHCPDQKYKLALSFLRERIRIHPRLTDSRAFAHKAVYADQMWLDGLFMLQPLYAQFAAEYRETDAFDDIAAQFALITQYAYNSEKELYYHAYDHSRSMFWADPVTGHSPSFWGRAMGWLSMAAVDTLDFFPADHPGRTPILDVIRKIAHGIIRYQNENGVWYQVLDQGSREGNYEESSCSCMFAYFLKKAVQMGYLDDFYLQYADKAMAGICKQFVTVGADGFVNISNVCLVAGLGPAKKPERDGSFAYYISEPVVDNDNKAFGALLCALTRFAAEEK